MDGARACLALVAVTVAISTRLGTPAVDAILAPLAVTLLAAHLDRESGTLAELVVRAAARLLPQRDRTDLCDEWIDHVRSAGEHGVLPLTRALSIALIAAPTLAVGLRVGRRRRARG